MKLVNRELEEIQKTLDYAFENVDLLYQAFTRSSYSRENGGVDNEVLEFLGDEVLDFYVSRILSEHFGYIKSEEEVDFDEKNQMDGYVLLEGYSEKELTKIKQELVDNKMLAHRIDKLGFNKYLFLGIGDRNNNIQNELKVKADLFEAILGAVAIDSNWNATILTEVVSNMLSIDNYLHNGLDSSKDYVTLIQQWNQKKNKALPLYIFTRQFDRLIKASLKLDIGDGIVEFEARGTTKVEARSACAKEAYEFLEDNNLLSNIYDELPEDINLENAINTLQELAQKKYISMPVYEVSDNERTFEDGTSYWECTCMIPDLRISQVAASGSKKTAKKYAAYLTLCVLFGFKDRYQNK